MLGTFVVLYLFLGGVGAGALFVAAVWSLLFHRTVTRTFEQSRAFRALAGRPRRLWAPSALGVLSAD